MGLAASVLKRGRGNLFVLTWRGSLHFKTRRDEGLWDPLIYVLEKEKKGDFTIVPEVQKLKFLFPFRPILTPPNCFWRKQLRRTLGRPGPGGEASGRGDMKTDLRWHLRHGSHVCPVCQKFCIGIFEGRSFKRQLFGQVGLPNCFMVMVPSFSQPDVKTPRLCLGGWGKGQVYLVIQSLNSLGF